MDINLLVLNLGNSRLAMAAFAAGQLTSVKHIPHSLKSDWAAAIADVWAKSSELDDVAVAGASVNPPLEAEIEQAVMKATGKRIEWVGPTSIFRSKC